MWDKNANNIFKHNLSVRNSEQNLWFWKPTWVHRKKGVAFHNLIGEGLWWMLCSYALTETFIKISWGLPTYMTARDGFAAYTEWGLIHQCPPGLRPPVPVTVPWCYLRLPNVTAKHSNETTESTFTKITKNAYAEKRKVHRKTDWDRCRKCSCRHHAGCWDTLGTIKLTKYVHPD